MTAMIMPATRVSAATFRRRRAVAAVLLAAVVSTVGFGLDDVLSGPGGVPASAAGAGTAPAVSQVRAEVGDSLWAIAERFHGDVPMQRYVDALADLNGGTAIVAGQVVRLP
ncbi:MAG: LysM peptidoglycan-binding domain-containing protein [Ilumatobacteraceae bacterium]